MSYERPDPERGAYTPRTDDDLPFDRSGFDARNRRGGGGRGPGGGGRGPAPITLILSAIVLLALIIAVILYYRSGVRGEGEAPPVVAGDGVTASAPATPSDGADVEVYDPVDEQLGPPDEVGVPPPLDETVAPPVTPTPSEATTPAETRPTPPPVQPRPTPPPVQPRPTPPPAAASGSAAVQIGAFSSQEAAERAYAEVAASYPQYASGRTRGIQRTTTSDGRTVYRTTMNGFSGTEARAFCGALRAAGRDCIVN